MKNYAIIKKDVIITETKTYNESLNFIKQKNEIWVKYLTTIKEVVIKLIRKYQETKETNLQKLFLSVDIFTKFGYNCFIAWPIK